MIKRRGFPRIFFGWWAVVIGSFLSLWGTGFHLYGFSALFKPMSAELGFSRAATSAAAGIARFEGGLEAPLTGWLTDRLGPRRVILFGVALAGLGLILMNFIHSLWAFYLVWGLAVGSGFNISGLPGAVAIANWFVKKRGLALGLRWVLSGALVLPLVTWLITAVGWRMTCVIGGVVLGLIGLPLTWFGIRDKRPEYYGLLPDGATAEEEAAEASQTIERGIRYAAEVEEVEFTLRQAIRTPAYWLLIVAQASQGIASSSLMLHFIPLLTDIGMSPSKAAATLTISALAGMAMRLISGLIADRIKVQHLRFIIGGAWLVQAAGITIFLLSNQTIAVVYPFLILFFLGFGANLTLMFLVGGRYFGRKAFGSIRGTSSLFSMPFGVISPIYAGWIYDTTGNYTVALTTFVALLAVAVVLMLLARPPKPPAEVTDIHKIL